MDMDAFANDLKTEVKKLPKDLILILKELAEKFGPTLDKLVPGLMAGLGRHLQVIMMEAATGILDKKELNDTISKVLRESV